MGITHTNVQIDISKKKFWKKFPPGGSDPQNFFKQLMLPYGNVPAQFYRNISRTAACGRVQTFGKRNSSTFEAKPPSRGGSRKKNFFAYFFLGHEHYSPTFSDRNLEKILGKKFPPGGLTPKIFFEVTIPPLGQCACKIALQYLKNCGLWTCANIRKT